MTPSTRLYVHGPFALPLGRSGDASSTAILATSMVCGNAARSLRPAQQPLSPPPPGAQQRALRRIIALSQRGRCAIGAANVKKSTTP